MFKLIYLEDWVGLYKNEKCIYQDHSIPSYKLFELLGIEVKEEYVENWNPDMSYLPENLEDLNLD